MKECKYVLAWGGLLLLVTGAVFGEAIVGWPKFDEQGIPVSWNGFRKKWGGPWCQPWRTRAFGDVTGNGKENVVVAKGPGMAIFEKGDKGPWTEIAEYVHPVGDAEVSMIAIGDTDGDKRQEIFFGTGTGNNLSNAYRVYVYEHTKSNDFAQVGLLGPYNNMAGYVKITDANSDGKLEVIVTSERYIRIYATAGDNTWKEIWKIRVAENAHPDGVEAADLDNDKKPELYIGASSYDSSSRKAHGWLYVYEMTTMNQYDKIWQSDDFGIEVTDMGVFKENKTGKYFIGGRLKIGPTWALFELTGDNTYSLAGVKTETDIDELFEREGPIDIFGMLTKGRQ